MRKMFFVLLVATGISFAENLYTDGSSDIKTCIASGTLASVDVPCGVEEVFFSEEVEADAKPGSPKTVVFGLKEKKKSGSLTIACKDRSYTLIITSGKDCDSKKVIVDRRDRQQVKVDATEFNTEALLNTARGLLKGMISGQHVRGYEIKPITRLVLINNDDYLKAVFDTVYDGSGLVGFSGRIKNHSKYIDKQIDIKRIMQKGYILLYIEGLNEEKITLKPQEERRIYIVALKSSGSIPFNEVK